MLHMQQQLQDKSQNLCIPNQKTTPLRPTNIKHWATLVTPATRKICVEFN